MLLLSLGENCMAGIMLRRLGVMNTWSTPYTYARSNIQYAIQCEEDGYTHLLDECFICKDSDAPFPQNWRNNLFEIKDSSIFNRTVSSGFEFAHHNVVEDISARRSYERKIDRMRKLRDSNEDVVFFYNHRYISSSDIYRVAKDCSRFADYYCNIKRKCTVVIIEQRIIENNSARHIEIERFDDRCVVIYFYCLREWSGGAAGYVGAELDDDLICEMFKMLNHENIIHDISFLDNYVLSKNMYFNIGNDYLEKSLSSKIDVRGCELYIWGANATGKAFAEYLLKRNIAVKSIIDNDISKQGKDYLNIPITSCANVKDYSKIIVTAMSDNSVKQIKDELRMRFNACEVVIFKDMV